MMAQLDRPGMLVENISRAKETIATSFLLW